ncbi:MAG: biotin-dependent carboxyltransferase [Chloroflexia bacterium]|nr:biotin-dependent carboxyltransferase [Chloroflexia bacterium]
MSREAGLRVVTGGLLTTVQDQGRIGALRYGVPRGGAMDRFALYAANRLVGNAPDEAGLEMLVSEVCFEVLQPSLLALTGAPIEAYWNDTPLPLWTTILARPGDQISLAGKRHGWGARSYLALAGGVEVPVVLGSRGTHLSGRFGGLAGRVLRTGDLVMLRQQPSDPLRRAGQSWPEEARPAYGFRPRLRFTAGPHQRCFDATSIEALAQAELRVSDHANRMGYRLDGHTVELTNPCSLPSLGVLPGVIQVPPDGKPVLLMADAQPTGGYPIIGVVCAPDLALAAQLLPGDSLHLQPIGEDEAIEARRDDARWKATPLEPDDTIAQLALAGG